MTTIERIAQDQIPILDCPVSDDDLLCLKLKQEISHLQRWLEAQSENHKHPTSQQLAPTIKALIETRQKLLYSIQHTN